MQIKNRYIDRFKKDLQIKNKKFTREVYQLNKDTLEIINEFKSIAEASKETNILGTTINRNCRHKSNSAGGYSWIYKDEYEAISKEELHRLYSYKYKKPSSTEHYEKSKVSVICLNTKQVFDGIIDAIKYFGLCKGARIDAVCRGTRKSAGKHPRTNEPLRWAYYKDYIKI